MPRRVLVVCVGNICRSPMAAALLESALPDTFVVTSAGVGALVGEKADATAIELLAEKGLSLEHHIARQIDAELLSESDMVLAMEQRHVRWIEQEWPQARGRVFRWGHWGDFDVPDPYRRGEGAFRDALSLIEKGLEDWKVKLSQLG